MNRAHLAHRVAAVVLLAATPWPAPAQNIEALPTPIAPAPAPNASTPAPTEAPVAPPAVTPTVTPAPAAEREAAEPAPPRVDRAAARRPAPRPVPEPEPAADPPVDAAPPEPAARDALGAETAAPPATADDLPAPAANAAGTAEPVSTPEAQSGALWPWLAGGALLLALLVWALTRRGRRDSENLHHDDAVEPVVVEPVDQEPTNAQGAVAAPTPDTVPTAPVEPMVEPRGDAIELEGERIIPNPAAYAAGIPVLNAAPRKPQPVDHPANPLPAEPPLAAAVGDAAEGDLAALAAESAAPAGRPWLELLMRPIRAGTSATDAVVEFELTVGNTGDAPARDVRISTWMFAAGSPEESEIEGLLIDPPEETRLSEVTIAPGDGAKVEATVALSRAGLEGAVLPVVVADARYPLPDGGEGRVSARFAVGLGEDVEPFPLDQPRGAFSEDIGARLHGELIRA